MNYNIPLNVVNSEAAVVGAVTLTRFLIQASINMDNALANLNIGKKDPLIGDIKEALYVKLYRTLLSKEAAAVKNTPQKKTTPYGQELDFVLNTVSTIILSMHDATSRRIPTKKNLSDFEILSIAVRDFDPHRFIKYFYAGYLSSAYAFYLSNHIDNNLNRHHYLANIVIRNYYINAHVRHCQATIYRYLHQVELNKEALETANETLLVRETGKLVRALSKMNFTVKPRQKYRPITRHVLCGSAIHNPDSLKQFPRGGISGRVIKLDVDEQKGNINLRIDQIEQLLGKKLSPESKDLLEIAGYIYVADTRISRGPRWRRSIRLVIPVRCLALWKSLASLLSYSLSFLSGDSILFDFYEYEKSGDPESKISSKGKIPKVDSVCLFSGGADSFASTLMAIKDKSSPLVISHFAQYHLAHLQRDIVKSLSAKYPRKDIKHLMIDVGKKNDRNNEFRLSSNLDNTQRTRSFLYFSLASVIAMELGLQGFGVHENGIQCFNLPITPGFASTRCGRPTHPRNIYNFNQIITRLYKKDFMVYNDYSLKLKSQLLRDAIKTRDEEDLLSNTTSCFRFPVGINFDLRRKNRKCCNCGTCYSCILRLVSIHSANFNIDYTKYVANPLQQVKNLKDAELATLVRFMGFCHEFSYSSPAALLAKHPELCLPGHYFPGIKSNDIVKSSINMHRNFAKESLSWLKEEGDIKTKQILGVNRDTPGMTVDVHCHIDRYADPFYVLSKIAYENIKIVSVATDYDSTRATFSLAGYFKSVIPSVGLHPLHAPEYFKDLDGILKYIDHTPCVGEIGLDYYHERDPSNRSIQREVFTRFLDYCKGKDKILNVHSLNSEKDVLDKLVEYGISRAILHWFAGPKELLPAIISNRYYVSVNRSIKYSAKIKSIVASLPRDLILTESDGPVKYRKHTHTPFDIPETLAEIARIWKVTNEEARSQVNSNFKELMEVQPNKISSVRYTGVNLGGS